MTRQVRYYVEPFEGIYRKASINWVRRNHWRVRHALGTEDDAMQQCAEVYLKCRNKYAVKPIKPEHFMALFKVSLSNEWIRLAQRDTRERNILAEFYEPERVDYNIAELSLALSKASWELRYFISVIAEAPNEFVEVLFSVASIKDMNTQILGILGLYKSRRNVLKELKALCRK